MYEHTSFYFTQENDQDVQTMAYEDIMNIKDTDNVFLYYYPGVKVSNINKLQQKTYYLHFIYYCYTKYFHDKSSYLFLQIHSLHELMGHSQKEEATHETIHSTVEVHLKIG